MPPPFFTPRSVNLPEGCRLSKMSASRMGKGGEPNRNEFDSRQITHSTIIRTRLKGVFSEPFVCRPHRATARFRPPHKILRKNALISGRRILSEMNLGLCKAKTQEILTDFRVF